MEVPLSAVHQPAYDGTHLGDYLEDTYSFIYSAYCKVFDKEVGVDGVKYLDLRDTGSL